MQSHLKECSQRWKKLDWNRFPLSELLHLYSFALQWTAWLKNVQVHVHLDGNATKIAMTHWNIGVDSDWCYIYVKSEQPIFVQILTPFLTVHHAVEIAMTPWDIEVDSERC